MNINFPKSTSPASQSDVQSVRTPRGDKAAQGTGNSGSAQVGENSVVSLGDTTVTGLKALISNQPGVRQDRVQSLQQAIHNGTYQVSGKQLANAIHADLFGGGKSGS